MRESHSWWFSYACYKTIKYTLKCFYPYKGPSLHVRYGSNSLFTYMCLPILFLATLLDGGTFATFADIGTIARRGNFPCRSHSTRGGYFLFYFLWWRIITKIMTECTWWILGHKCTQIDESANDNLVVLPTCWWVSAFLHYKIKRTELLIYACL